MGVADAKRPRVLMVDDDAVSRLLAAESLRGCGFDVEEAADGPDGLERFDAFGADLVLLDVVMPRLDGFQVCAAIREHPQGTHVPIVIMTGLEDDGSIARAYELGATDFVVKPLNFAVLDHRLRYILRSNGVAERLRHSEARLAEAQRMAKLGYWVWEVDSDHAVWSDSLREEFGLDSASIQDAFQLFLAHVHPGDRAMVRERFGGALKARVPVHFEHGFLGPGGEHRVLRHEVEVVRGVAGDVTRMHGTVQDISERRSAEQRIHELAYADRTTGLPNLTFLRELLGRVLERNRAHGARCALLCVDVDDFNLVNQSLGRATGDRLLRELALRLRCCLRRSDVLAEPVQGEQPPAEDGDTVARFGGDEFVMLLSDIGDARNAAAVAERLTEQVAPAFEVEGERLYLTVSVGIIVAPDDGDEPDALLENVEAAMRSAKERGRNSYRFFTPALNERAARNLAIVSRLRDAIDADVFDLHYQPKVAVADGRPLGVEALLRWTDPELGAISPGEFVPVAERFGLIGPIGAWVLSATCAQVAAWMAEGAPVLPVAVNLSPPQFQDPTLPASLRDLLREYGLPASSLELEVTETAVMDDVDTSRRTISALRDMGIGVSLDDFGTGYSSLSHLRSLPLSMLKVDRCFVTGVCTEPGDAAIASAIVALAHKLGMGVVAEGVETEDQLAYLRDQGCDEAQGFLFSRPLPAADLRRWLAGRTGPALERAG